MKIDDKVKIRGKVQKKFMQKGVIIGISRRGVGDKYLGRGGGLNLFRYNPLSRKLLVIERKRGK